MQDLVLPMAVKLCNIPSVTYDEKLVCDYLDNYFSQKQFIVKKFFVKDSQRYNLFVCKKDLEKYHTILCTHLDTVPEFFKPIVDQNQKKLFARGSCDAKGIAACMISAFLKLVKDGYDDLALLFTVGEETDSDGAKSFFANFNKTSEFLVVGEPTDFLFASEQMGVLAFDLSYTGKKAHSALAHLGDNAINKLIKDCNTLLSYNWANNIINLGELEGGNARNIISDKAVAKFLMRISQEPAQILKTIKEILSHHADLQIISQSEPFFYFVPPEKKSFVATFGSDAPYLKAIADHIILTGPGSLSVAHQDDEYITFADLYDGYLHYVDIVENFKKRS